MLHDRGAGGTGTNPFFGQILNFFGRYWGTQIDYRREVGDLTQSRLIMAAVNFLGRTLPEAKLEVVKPKSDGTVKTVVDHPLVKLFKRPNKHYTGSLLLMAMGLSWIIAGNVYIYKVRNILGEVIELWYLPHHMIEPRWEGNSFIDYYAYQVDGVEYKLKPSDVMHLRNGIDPQNTRLGLSPIAAALREIFSDNERANFSALLLKNAGVPPFVISPKVNQSNLSDTDQRRIQDAFLRKTMGDERGKPAVMSNAIDVTKIGFTPDEMDLKNLSRVPEETIASLTGIPAIVLQFGAGLERSTFANYSEAREATYESVIVPLWVYLGEEFTHQLLADFDKSEKLEARFNTSNVRVLQDDENKLFDRVGKAYKYAFIMRAEARSKTGFEVRPEDYVFIHEAIQKAKPKDEKENEKNDES